MKTEGTERVRAVGDWVITETDGTTPMGGSFTAILTLGYDTEKKQFVGTWICSMFSRMLHYDGSLDAAGKTLTLNTEGPDFANPRKLAKYRDIIEIKDKDTRVQKSAVLADDGNWYEFQTVIYRRKAP